MLTRTLRLQNDFHGTEVTVRVRALGQVRNVLIRTGQVRLSEGQWRRVRDTLCGSADCTCGVVRGPQDEPLEYLTVGDDQIAVV